MWPSVHRYLLHARNAARRERGRDGFPIQLPLGYTKIGAWIVGDCLTLLGRKRLNQLPNRRYIPVDIGQSRAYTLADIGSRDAYGTHARRPGAAPAPVAGVLLEPCRLRIVPGVAPALTATRCRVRI